jgi:Tfp pilus assembly protein PilV
MVPLNTDPFNSLSFSFIESMLADVVILFGVLFFWGGNYKSLRNEQLCYKEHTQIIIKLFILENTQLIEHMRCMVVVDKHYQYRCAKKGHHFDKR